MNFLGSIGKYFEYGSEYLDNKIELAKLEVAQNTSKIFSKAILLAISLFLLIVIYFLILIVVVVALLSLVKSVLIILIGLIVFHVFLGVLVFKYFGASLSNKITTFITSEFTDIDEQSMQQRVKLSLSDYKTKLLEVNQKIVDDVKANIFSPLFKNDMKIQANGNINNFSEQNLETLNEVQMILGELLSKQ